MFKITVATGFVSQALNLLTNSTNMTHTVYRNGRILAIDKADVDEAHKILEKSMIPYHMIVKV